MINTPAPVRTPIISSLLPRSFRQRMGDAFTAFNTAFFSPGPPLEPNLETKNEPPRQFAYQAGSNFNYIPRASEGLTPFSWLINMADLYDTARMCIRARCDEMASYEWAIVPLDQSNKPSALEESEARGFLQKPDGFHRWDTWIVMALEEVLVTDALSIFLQKNRRGDQILGLELLDGSSIRPLVDTRGRTPPPPAPAYQQVMYGQVLSEWTTDQLLYQPKHLRTRSMYGRSPTEELVLTINRALRRQTFDIHWFTDGNIPEAIIPLPDLPPDQIEVIQSMFDNIVNNPQQRRKIHFIPGQSRLSPFQFKQQILDPAIEQFLDRRVMAMYGVMPQALGFSEDSNRAQAGIQENVELRRRLPYLRFFSGLLTEVLHVNGWTRCKMQFLAEKPDEDLLRQAQVDQLYVAMGKNSVDELRIRDNEPAWGVGPYVNTGVGPVPLKEALTAGAENIQSMGQGGDVPERVGNHDQQVNPSHNAGDREMQDGERTQTTTRADAIREVRHWQRWATRHLGQEEGAFTFNAVPRELADELTLAWDAAESDGDIRRAADLARSALA